MSLFKVLDIAGSGLSAQSLRLNLTASNLANADSVSGGPGTTYRARYPVFSTALLDANRDQGSVGVRVSSIVESEAPFAKEFSPDHPGSGRRRIYLSTQRECGGADGRHDLGVPDVSE